MGHVPFATLTLWELVAHWLHARVQTLDLMMKFANNKLEFGSF